MKTAVDALKYLREALEGQPEDAVFVYDPLHKRYRQFHQLLKKLHRRGFVVLEMISGSCFYARLNGPGKQSLSFRLKQKQGLLC